MQTSSRVCTARCSDHLEVQEIVFYLSDRTGPGRQIPATWNVRLPSAVLTSLTRHWSRPSRKPRRVAFEMIKSDPMDVHSNRGPEPRSHRPEYERHPRRGDRRLALGEVRDTSEAIRARNMS